MITYDISLKNLCTPSQNDLPKKLSSRNKNPNPIEKNNSIQSPPPLPFYIPITTLRVFFFLSNFLHLKKLTINTQLCTGKIEAIPE